MAAAAHEAFICPTADSVLRFSWVPTYRWSQDPVWALCSGDGAVAGRRRPPRPQQLLISMLVALVLCSHPCNLCIPYIWSHSSLHLCILASCQPGSQREPWRYRKRGEEGPTAVSFLSWLMREGGFRNQKDLISKPRWPLTSWAALRPVP